MRKAVALALLLAATPACAQVGIPFPGPGGAGGAAAGYQGPLDILGTATVAWGLRALSTTFADGTHVGFNINRLSDSNSCDVLFGTDGKPSILKKDVNNFASCGTGAVTDASFCNATSCFVTKWYDQSGNGRDAIDAIPANNVTYVPSATISSVGATWATPHNTKYCTSASIATGQPQSASGVYNRTAGGGYNGVNDFDPNHAQFMGVTGSANQVQIYDGSGTPTATASDAAYHAFAAIWDSTSSHIYIDGTDMSLSGAALGTGNSTAAPICISNQLNSYNGVIREYIQWPVSASTLTGGIASSLSSNQKTFWGF